MEYRTEREGWNRERKGNDAWSSCGGERSIEQVQFITGVFFKTHFYNHCTYTCLGSTNISSILLLLPLLLLHDLYVFESSLHTSYFPSAALKLTINGPAPTYMLIFFITGIPTSLYSRLRTLFF